MIPTVVLVPLEAFIMFFAALAAYFFKRAAENFSLHPVKLLKNYYFISAAVVWTLASLAYVTLLKFEDLGIVYPLTSFQYLWALVLSYWLLKEHITKTKLAGVGCIIVGVILLVGFR